MIARTAAPRAVDTIPVVHHCPTCGRFSHLFVQFAERCEPIIVPLADKCRGCNTAITPETIADLIDSATLLRSSPIGGAA